MLHTRKRGLAVAGLAVLIAALLIAALDRGSVAHSAVQPPSPTALAEYSVFSARNSASVPLPAGSVIASETKEGASTSIPTGSSLKQWATVTGDRMCVVVDTDVAGHAGTAAACNSASKLSADHELLATGFGGSGEPGSVKYIVGIAPNSVTDVTVVLTNGTSTQAPVINNGFHLVVSPPVAVSEFRWQDASGKAYSQKG
ncbi:MAG: hypothetical protein ACYDCQ_16010 [Dehalococcoidia bacterium]